MANAPETQHVAEGEPLGHSGLAETITPALAAGIEAMLANGAVQFLSIRSMGGATSDVASHATPFAHREAQFSISGLGRSRTSLDAAWATIEPHLDGTYFSFETDTGEQHLVAAFGQAGLARLRALKAEVDPDDVFAHNFSVAVRSDA